MSQHKILFIIGTRPEAVKLAPLIRELRSGSGRFEVRICLTNQHEDLALPVLQFFGIREDFQLHWSRQNAGLFQLSGRMLEHFEPVFLDYRPEWVIVQGDTNSAFAGALAAYYAGARILHVEAGLRTGDKRLPFPEEMNRKMIAALADLHAAPSEDARRNLLREGVPAGDIIVSGNTGIDALLQTVERLRVQIPEAVRQLEASLRSYTQRKWVVSTIHRRENRGPRLQSILEALLDLSRREDLHLIHLLHPNPEVAEPVKAVLGQQDNISLLPPQPYEAFVWLMQQSYCLVSDSGGIQEEAPSLKKPVVVVRKKTERPLLQEWGAGVLVGSERQEIIRIVNRLLDDPVYYQSFGVDSNPYGDGRASERIADFLSTSLAV